MNRLYTIKGYNIHNKERYIQLSYSGKPIIQTRTGYRADNVILFETKEDAYKFLINFINDRKRSDIMWNVEEYYPSRTRNCIVCNIKCEYGYKVPGEVRVDSNGDVYKKFYKRRIAKFDEWCKFYCRNNSIKEV